MISYIMHDCIYDARDDTFVAVVLWRLSHCNNFTAGAGRTVAMETSASVNLKDTRHVLSLT